MNNSCINPLIISLQQTKSDLFLHTLWETSHICVNIHTLFYIIFPCFIWLALLEKIQLQYDLCITYSYNADSPVTKLSLLLSLPRVVATCWGKRDELLLSVLPLLLFPSLLPSVIPQLQNSNCSGVDSVPPRSVATWQVLPQSSNSTKSSCLCLCYEIETD
jgi:hypothetical protein